MILHVLFVKFKGEALPKGLSVVDEQTINETQYTVDEYLEAAALQTLEMFKDSKREVEEWSWYDFSAPTTTRNRIAEDINDLTLTFGVSNVEARPKAQPVTGVPGITVTVGRTPGTIVDDEIFGE